VVLLVAFGAGVAFAAINPILFAAGIPVGGLLGGLAVESLGLRSALLVAAVGYLVMTLSPFVFPRWRDLDHGRSVQPAAASLT
jgi:predicted MFS family arabinose efflux permease